MESDLFDRQDLEEIRELGMTPERVSLEIEQFKRGFPFAQLDRACTVGDGISRFDRTEMDTLIGAYSGAALSGRAMKFVPASGAASRMFKSLLAVEKRLSEESELPPSRLEQDPDGKAAIGFLSDIRDFAFFEELNRALERGGIEFSSLSGKRRAATILEYVLGPRGLNLSNLPKGLIPFHAYDRHARTPFEEHLVEAALTVRDGKGKTRVHFTVSPEHREMVAEHLEKVRPLYEKGTVRFDISLSAQEPSTDTIAVDPDNKPFRDRNGRLVFRPGGHGALLSNLGALGGDILFIKNIDNVVPDRLKEPTILYKRVLGGYLVRLQEKIFSYLKRLETGSMDQPLASEVLNFVRESLSVQPPSGTGVEPTRELREFLFDRLNRPLRVCGMVKNEGEPGGGPYWVRSRDGGLSIQIVESSQVNMGDADQKSIWRSATHFNPVDLVCGVRDYLGKPFDLMRFIDPDTGFISRKSKDGRELKALELPGLWNGAMALWNTAFVEVPSATFSPVKTVLDLLRAEHQAR